MIHSSSNKRITVMETSKTQPRQHVRRARLDNMSKRFQGRSAVACRMCRTQKLKCSGGDPCQRCQARGRKCIYPVKDRLLNVPESYIRRLEAQANSTCTKAYPPEQSHLNQQDHLLIRSEGLDGLRLSDDCSAERFVEKVKELSSVTATGEQSPSRPARPASTTAGRYTYARLNFDFNHSEVSIKLPPRPYAFHLLQVFEEGYCDYHWFLRSKFRGRLALTYSDPQSQANDRNWLCRVSVVMALAEAWNRGRSSMSSRINISQPSLSPTEDSQSDFASYVSFPSLSGEAPSAPPGAEFFEQCLLLLKMSLEEPNVEDVEALNLIAFYSYSLNRRRTAFFYARQSVSLAKLLSLDKPSSSAADSIERIQNEHKKRVWWTCYCMDRMVSTELGITPIQESGPDGLQYPDSSQLSVLEKEDFFEPYLLTAQVQLCTIKSRVVKTVTQHLRVRDVTDPADVLRPCIGLLQTWRESLPVYLSFHFDTGIPSEMLDLPFHRVLASLYLRYHQCVILLFRPFFLQELAVTIRQNLPSDERKGTPFTPSCYNDTFTPMVLECLQAAKHNCRILVDLWKISKIAKFGYWESMHLFSGLAILSLSRLMTPTISFGSSTNPKDNIHNAMWSDEADSELLSQARVLLEDMASVGNPAAQDFKVMLGDIEAMVQKVLNDRQENLNTAAQPTWGPTRSIVADNQIFDTGDSDVSLLDGLLDEQIWYDIDWENVLRV